MKFSPVVFPRDGQAHKNIIEWWYFNGHVHDARGRQYSYMDCFFQAHARKVKFPYLSKIPLERISKSPYYYFAHSVVSDLQSQKSDKDIQYVSLLSKDSFSKQLMYVNYVDPVTSDGYVNCEIIETKPFSYHLKTKNLDLYLESKKKPLLQGGRGFVSVCKRQTYYYSLTDCITKGAITINGKRISVEGKSWMDHQWADAPYRKDKWTWFCLQLDNGTDIMCVEYDSGNAKDYLVDIIDAKGAHYHSRKVDITTAGRMWQSKKTKANYPLDWSINIPEKDVRVTVKAKIKEQEMIFGAVAYWEGPIAVQGRVGAKQVTGVGFMELLGYANDYHFPLLAGKELERIIMQKIKKSGSVISQKILSRFHHLPR